MHPIQVTLLLRKTDSIPYKRCNKEIIDQNESCLTHDLDDSSLQLISTKKVNQASYVPCTNKPSLVFSKKGELLAKAQKKVHDDGFVYKKGHRSKRYCIEQGNEITVDSI